MTKSEYSKRMFHLVNGKYSNKEGGVYQIRCKVNGQFYIGSTNNFERRFAIHLFELNNKSHHNYKLQIDFDKFGPENFEFIKLVNLGRKPKRSTLYDLEQENIDKLKPHYNIQLVVERINFSYDAKVKPKGIRRLKEGVTGNDLKGKPRKKKKDKRRDFKNKPKNNKNNKKSLTALFVPLLHKWNKRSKRRNTSYLKEENKMNNLVNQRRRERESGQ